MSLRTEDFATGSGAVSLFSQPRQMSAHTNSIIAMLLTIQKRRKEPQSAVEVGVWQGQTSRWLLAALPRLTLHMVDPWQEGDPAGTWRQHGDSMSKQPQSHHDKNLEICREIATLFNPRAVLHRLFSVEAAALFPDESQEVVFIDGAHDYANVAGDIAAWHKKVKPGGWLAGHDYKETGRYEGVARAVKEFSAAKNLPYQVMPGKVWAFRYPLSSS
jgi:hypothetical protein